MTLNLKFLVAAVLASFSVVSYAATEDDVVIVKRSAKEIYENSSEANRIDKKFDVHFKVIGFSANNALAQGLGVGYFIDRNKQILMEAQKGKGLVTRWRYEYSNGASREWSTDTQISRIGVHYKHFVGNSFYYRAGADYSVVDYKYDLTGSFSADASSSNFRGTALIGSFVIGNQWQWDNFTLGCDWIGLASPLMYTLSGAAPTTSSEKSDFEEDQKKYVSDGSAVLLRLYLGASF